MRETIITIALLGLIAGGGWAWYKYVREAPSPDLETSQLGEQREQNERLRQYRQLNSLKPDLSLLDQPVFRTLQAAQAAATTTGAIPRGRPNPFAPF